jgi:NADH-quinone oxidoreductase subunit B
MAADFLGIAVAEIASLSERHTNRLLNPVLSGLPDFLVEGKGLNSGLMVAQYTQAALVSENKVLAHPGVVDSISVSADQEDHVSMAPVSTRKLKEIIKNTGTVLAIEMMSAVDPKYDMSRFGSEVMRFTPRQCDLMIVAGTVTYKMAHVVRRVYDQMPDPKWVIAMGACTSSGGMYRSYNVVQGIDQFITVHIYNAGCPPRPDNLLNALMEVQKIIDKSKSRDFQDRPLPKLETVNE